MVNSKQIFKCLIQDLWKYIKVWIKSFAESLKKKDVSNVCKRKLIICVICYVFARGKAYVYCFYINLSPKKSVLSFLPIHTLIKCALKTTRINSTTILWKSSEIYDKLGAVLDIFLRRVKRGIRYWSGWYVMPINFTLSSIKRLPKYSYVKKTYITSPPPP